MKTNMRLTTVTLGKLIASVMICILPAWSLVAQESESSTNDQIPLDIVSESPTESSIEGDSTEEEAEIPESPLDLELYQQAQNLKEEALQKLEAGEYESSIELSERSADLSVRARLLASELYAQLRANAFRRQAAAALERSSRNRNRSEDQEALFTDALAYYQDGLDLLDQEEYQTSIVAFQDTLAVLEVANSGASIESPAGSSSESSTLGQLILPAEYEVRLIPEDRDTLNKISGYPFVYGDRTEWQKLYEANRDRLRESDNPHLIFPEQVFVIPSIAGEIREGRWDPSVEYPSLEELEKMMKDTDMEDKDAEMKDENMEDSDMKDENMEDSDTTDAENADNEGEV